MREFRDARGPRSFRETFPLQNSGAKVLLSEIYMTLAIDEAAN